MNLVRAFVLPGLSIVAFLFFAGCVGGSAGGAKQTSESIPPAPSPEFDDASGAIQGSVVDDQLAPLGNAQVLASETKQTVSTDANGAFTFSHLAPGAYQLFAAALGYESAARRVTVEAGETATVQFQLAPIPVATAYSEKLVFDGYFECTWRGPRGSGPCFFPDADLSAYMPNQKRAFLYNVWPHLRTWVGELSWKTTSFATTQTLSEFLSYANRTTSHVWGTKEGVSPVKLTCSRTADEYEGCSAGGQGLSEKPEIPEKGIYVRHWVTTGRAQVAGQSPVGYGISFQQSFKLYASMFYGEPAPEDYSAVPDE